MWVICFASLKKTGKARYQNVHVDDNYFHRERVLELDNFYHLTAQTISQHCKKHFFKKLVQGTLAHLVFWQKQTKKPAVLLYSSKLKFLCSNLWLGMMCTENNNDDARRTKHNGIGSFGIIILIIPSTPKITQTKLSRERQTFTTKTEQH